MAYRRRYFEPFVGTTETIGDKSITPDKIDDKAVGTAQLGDDAVISEKIKDGTIRSEDLKDGEVKTADLGLASVTESKIADNSVTTYKIGYQAVTGSKIRDGTITTEKFVSPPITRPITPPATTAEIGDGQITAPKMAADAIETVAIKDNAITSPKIAPDSILAGDIAANAIEGPEIKAGVVGTDKLSTDAVTPVKVDAIDAPADGEVLAYDDATETFEWVPQPTVITKHTDLTDKEVAGVIDHADLSVTEPKLEADFLRKYLEGRQVFYDDFLGTVLDNRWAQSGETGGSAIISPRSKVLISTPATMNAYYRINWNGKRGIYVGKLPKFFAKVTPTGDPDLNVFVGLYKDVNNLIWFGYEPGVGFNWLARCISGGSVTTIDTGVPVDDTLVELLIDVVTTGEVKFYIDGVLKATINTDIPATSDVEPWLEVQALTAGVVSLTVDNVIISANPE